MPSKFAHAALTAFLVFVWILLQQCRAAVTDSNHATLHKQIEERLGKDFAVEYNDSRRFVLCYQKPVEDHSQREFQFVVVSTATERVVKEGTFRMGYAKWIDDNTIEVLTTPDFRSESMTQRFVINETQN